MSSPSLVDDTNPAVQYAPGWIWDQNVNEVDHTRHGAATAGLTASLGFYGTGVQVIGTLEPSANYGQPTTTYKIDGIQEGTYTAPFTASGDPHFNVTFFSKFDLTLDNHEIEITNVNGTNPNTFWLDYFLIYNQTVPSSSTTTSTSTSVTPFNTPTNTVVSSAHSISTTSTTTSSSTAPVLTALVSSLSTTSSSSLSSSSSSSSSSSTDPTTHSFSDAATTASSSTTPTTSSAASDSSQSSAHSNTSKIVGGVVGGVAFLALLALFFFCLLRRRRAQDDIEPFAPDTRERSSSSGTLLGGRSPAAKVNKIPELSLASSTPATPATFPSSRSYPATFSELSASAQPSELRAPISGASISGASEAAGGPSAPAPSPTSPQHGPGLSPTDTKLEESLYARSTPRLLPTPGSPLSPSSPSSGPGSVSLSAGASDYAPSLATTTTRAPADTEASRARWYAHAQEQSHAQSLLSLLSSRGRRRQDRDRGQEQDSGLRLYNEPALPPPYTAD